MAARHVPTASSISTSTSGQPPDAHPFPLANGDRLTRQEFEQRYAARPDIKKAELVEGVVYMPSPVHFAAHAEPHGMILAWLDNHGRASFVLNSQALPQSGQPINVRSR